MGQTPEAYAAGGWSFDGLCSDLRRRGYEPDESLVYALAGVLDGYPKDSAPDRGAAISAARQIDNVLASLLDLVDGPAFPDRMGQIRATARQLYGLWQLYQVGALEPLPTDPDIAF